MFTAGVIYFLFPINGTAFRIIWKSLKIYGIFLKSAIIMPMDIDNFSLQVYNEDSMDKYEFLSYIELLLYY